MFSSNITLLPSSATTNTTDGGYFFSPAIYDYSYTFLVHRSAVVVDVLSILISLVILLSLVFFTGLRQTRVWVMIVGISVGDIIFSFHHGLDHVLSLSDIQRWPHAGPLCTWLAIGTTAGFWYQSAWILSMCWSLLYEFMQNLKKEPDKLPMNYIYFFTSLLGILPWVIALGLGHFGPASEVHPTWCHFSYKHTLTGFLLFDIWMIIFNVLLLVCYMVLGFRFKQFTSYGTGSKKHAQKGLRRIILFPFTYSLQWIIYCTLLFYEQNKVPIPAGLTEATVLTANAGGILNGLVYFGMLIVANYWKNRKLELKLRAQTDRRSSRQIPQTDRQNLATS